MTMPRSIQEILDHADELAERFEDYDPQPGDERPVEEYLIQRAAIARCNARARAIRTTLAAHLCPSAHRHDERYGGCPLATVGGGRLGSLTVPRTGAECSRLQRRNHEACRGVEEVMRTGRGLANGRRIAN